jgi:hypothetical protein
MTEIIKGNPGMTVKGDWKFKTPAALAKVVDQYFECCPKPEITQSGLCLHVGISKSTLNVYHTREGFEDIVTMAKLRIENAYETSLREKGGAANIFALKNFGWHDRQEHEHSGSTENPLITKIVREVVNVKQIEYAPPVDVSEIVNDPLDDFSADAGFEDEYDDFLS